MVRPVNVRRRLRRLLRKLDLGALSQLDLLRHCEAEIPCVDIAEITAALRTVRREQNRSRAAEFDRQLRRLRAGIHTVYDQNGAHPVELPPLLPAQVEGFKDVARKVLARRSDEESDS